MTRQEAREAIKEAYGNSEYTNEIVKALEQEPKTDYKAFAEWVAREITDEENWECNSGAFPELACRKLNKLGVVDTDGKGWIYENEALEQEPNTDVLDKISAEINEYGSLWVEYKIIGHTNRDIEKIVEDVMKQAKQQVLKIIDKYR